MKIHGTYGDIKVEPYTGRTLEKITIPEYADIDRYDVREYQLFYSEDEYPPDGIDVLDIGFWTNKGDYVPPDTTHREMVQGNRKVVIAKEDWSDKEVYIFPADYDQPITCPKCGARSEFTETRGGQYRHTCLGCHYEFLVEFEKEKKEEPEAMSAGEALSVLVDYVEKDCDALDDSDLDEETAAYTKRVRQAVKVASTWMGQSCGLFEKYPEERFTK